MTLWLRLDVDFAEHKKVVSVPVQARWLHVAALCYCARNLTDGYLSGRAVKVIGAVCELTPGRWVKQLVQAGLWREEPDGYWINDYLEHQPSAGDMKEMQEKKRAAGRLGGQASGKARAEAGASKQVLEQFVEPHNKTRQDIARGLAVAPLSLTQRPTSYEGADTQPLDKLKTACGDTHDAVVKLNRAAKGSSEADIVAALEACTGPGVNDRLAVALSELKKRKAA